MKSLCLLLARFAGYATLTSALLRGAESTPAGNAETPRVSLESVRSETHEPQPNIRVAPGVFRISRSGALDEELTVWLQYEGSATPGRDYTALPARVTFPAKRDSLDLLVTALADELGEGLETVVALLQPDPTMGPRERYVVDPRAAAAKVLIADGSSAPDTRIKITSPLQGARFRAGEPITIEAVAIDSGGFIAVLEVAEAVATPEYHVAIDSGGFIAVLELFADGEKVGVSELAWPACVGCEPKPGEPAQHRFIWRSPPPGRHELVARAAQRLVFAPSPEEQRLEPPATSEPVLVSVVETSSTVQFGIQATRPVAEEISEPEKRMPLRGELVISRTGDTTQPAMVFVHYSGEATPGVDYAPLPWKVEIPAGERAVALEVRAIADGLAEGAEKLVATLSLCPPPMDPPAGEACVEAAINPEYASAGMLVCDDARCGRTASLELTRPEPGTKFRAGEPVVLHAVAIDPRGAIYRVEFWVGEDRIGVSEVWTFREPDPGDPMHHEFVWKDAPAGTHLLTARATDTGGAPLLSAPVEVTVVALPTLKVSILAPLSGSVFGPDEAVRIQVVASSESAGIERLEVYGDDDLLATANTGELNVSWEHPELGVHTVIARASSADGKSATSQPVRILVRPLPERGFVARTLPPAYAPGESLEVLLAATPPGTASAWAIADRPPTGWVVSAISHDGTWDAAWGVVRFGPFTDRESRSLSYRVTAPESAMNRQLFAGVASVDGRRTIIRGDGILPPAEIATGKDEAEVHFRGFRREGRQIRFEVAGEPGQICEIETSSDLDGWDFHSRVFVLEDGTVAVEAGSSTDQLKFFRVRPVNEP